MALNASDMKAAFQARIYAGLQRVFGPEASEGTNYSPEAQKQWRMMADAISDLAMDLVTQIQTNAQVIPGIQVVGTSVTGGPVTATTVTPGTIE
jgi:hypothetical protein